MDITLSTTWVEHVYEIGAEKTYPLNYYEHVWVEVNDVIVDITSDQFEDSTEPVIVSDNSKWHDTWKRKARNDIYNWKHGDGSFNYEIFQDFLNYNNVY